MGQNFYMAMAAFAVCFLLTLIISLLTRRTKTDKELEGLVYSLTPRVQGQGGAWYTRPTWVGGLVLAATLALNLLFR
jgi:SSS family solute:Na+ symporter